MHQLITLAFCFIYSTSLLAQDERILRELLEYKQPEAVESLIEVKRRKAMTSFYMIDLNGDFKNEKIIVEKNDGLDYMAIRDDNNKIIFRKKLETKGINSRVHKLRIKNISAQTVLITVFYYEGNIDYLEFNGTGRLYFITIDNSNLDTISMYQGPYYWQEKKGFKGEYFQRKYHVGFVDLNGDGTKEVLVKHHLISRAYMYTGKGKWKSFGSAKKL